jgi:glycosyltransferase involved in cell wall biosynthesis
MASTDVRNAALETAQSVELARRKRRVLILGPSLHAVSGVSTHLQQLLDSSLRTQVEFRHFQIGSEGRHESRLEQTLRLCISPFALLVTLALSRPDIVHLNTSLVVQAYWRDVIYLLIAKLAKIKVIYQVHGGKLPAEFFPNNVSLTRILRFTLRLPDVVVLLSKSELRAYREFLPGKNFELIANAIDATTLTRGKRIDQLSGVLRIIYIGRLIAAKGIFEMIDAIGVLRKRNITVELAIAGSGPEEDSLRRKVASANLSAHVEFCGSVFGKPKEELLLRSQIFVFPTYHPEGLPYALLEAMAAGAVPITCAQGAIPDVMQDGVHGIIVPPRDPVAVADAIERLHRDRESLARMRETSRARIAEHYSVPRLAQDFQQLYESL